MDHLRPRSTLPPPTPSPTPSPQLLTAPHPAPHLSAHERSPPPRRRLGRRLPAARRSDRSGFPAPALWSQETPSSLLLLQPLSPNLEGCPGSPPLPPPRGKRHGGLSDRAAIFRHFRASAVRLRDVIPTLFSTWGPLPKKKKSLGVPRTFPYADCRFNSSHTVLSLGVGAASAEGGGSILISPEVA